MTDTPASYLQIYLTPFLSLLERDDVTDLYINRPGEVWVETLGGTTEWHEVPSLTEAQLGRLARQVASVAHQGISREHPLLAVRLPDGSRAQIVGPPATREGMAIAIRKHLSADMILADLETQGAFAHVADADAPVPQDVELAELYRNRDWSAFLRAAVRARRTIIVSSGTSSTGKTTFLNTLLREIAPSERLILIEDTPELVLRHDNAVGLVAVRGQLGEALVTTDDLLVASLRTRPDRIILGELRGADAFTFLRAINTGHPGSLTTIHADSPGRAIEQLALMVLQSGANLTRQDITGYVENVVDIVVQLHRRGECAGSARLPGPRPPERSDKVGQGLFVWTYLCLPEGPFGSISDVRRRH